MGGRVPDLDLASGGRATLEDAAAGRDESAVGRESDGLHATKEAVQAGRLSAGLGLPQSHRSDFAGRGEGLAVGGEGEIGDDAVEAVDDVTTRARPRVPEANCLIERAGGDEPSVS